MKIFIAVFAAIAVIACSDKTLAPDIKDTEPEFDVFKTGNIWELSRDGSDMTITVLEESSEIWVPEFWHGDSVEVHRTRVLEIKYFLEKLPVYKYYAIAHTDSGIYFGTNYPAIPNLLYPDSVFYKDFNIPVTNINHNEYNAFTKDYGSFIFTYSNETDYTVTKENYLDSQYVCTQINHRREQKKFDVLLRSGETFVYNPDIGFLNFLDYRLKLFTYNFD